ARLVWFGLSEARDKLVAGFEFCARFSQPLQRRITRTRIGTSHSISDDCYWIPKPFRRARSLQRGTFGIGSGQDKLSGSGELQMSLKLRIGKRIPMLVGEVHSTEEIDPPVQH